jgi:fumarylacetoacetase
MPLDETHDPALTSWVESANEAGCPFPIQNLPFAVFRRRGSDEAFRIGVAIGDEVLDLSALASTGLCQSEALSACQESQLNALMALPAVVRTDFRRELSRLMAIASPHQAQLRSTLVPMPEVEYTLPAAIGDYTDFYTSIHHATNIGRLFRPDNPLLPNYEWVPIAYHGRSSSIGVSGQAFPRPLGQLKSPDAEMPTVGPCQRLDYELEVGIFAGPGNPPGCPIPIESAESHIFGLCLLNDWSARDIQTWEYQPLGPFLAKNFASTISPWVVTLDALAPFRSAFTRDEAYAAPLPYLSSTENVESGAVDMRLEVYLQTSQMKASGQTPERLSVSNFTDSFWTMAQLVTHHTMNGCNLRPGDLLGSGTLSGAGEGSQAALIELTRGGEEAFRLASGETRSFLEDGDTVTMRAVCERPGFRSIGFGEVEGTVLPARVQ